MAHYHVGCGFSGIYAGTVKQNGIEWQRKSVCTDEAIEAVRDYMIFENLGGFSCPKASSGGYEWTLKDGRKVTLTVAIEG